MYPGDVAISFLAFFCSPMNTGSLYFPHLLLLWVWGSYTKPICLSVYSVSTIYGRNEGQNSHVWLCLAGIHEFQEDIPSSLSHYYNSDAVVNGWCAEYLKVVTVLNTWRWHIEFNSITIVSIHDLKGAQWSSSVSNSTNTSWTCTFHISNSIQEVLGYLCST